MKRFALLALVALTGCATDYKLYAEAQTANARARAEADKAKYAALAEIARSGDSAAKVAAVMSLHMQGGAAPQADTLAAPKHIADSLLQWSALLVPVVGQMYAVNRQTGLGMLQSNNATTLGLKQSDNATALGINTNNTFLGMAKEINSPVVVTQPAPIVVTQPAPVIVKPEIVKAEIYTPPVAPTPVPTKSSACTGTFTIGPC